MARPGGRLPRPRGRALIWLVLITAITLGGLSWPRSWVAGREVRRVGEKLLLKLPKPPLIAPRVPVDRVKAARERLGTTLQDKVQAAGLRWPLVDLYLRSFKEGDSQGARGFLEVWGSDRAAAPYKRVARYEVCSSSGTLGPKRREGDKQVPEGYYTLQSLNPNSRFHLSMLVGYPNKSDVIRGRKLDRQAHLGGEIMVHGDCVTIGCIPIQDEPIEEVYLLVEPLIGVRTVPIHIFPRPLSKEGLAALLAEPGTEDHHTLWRELAEGYQAFEATHRVPRVQVLADGRYQVQAVK